MTTVDDKFKCLDYVDCEAEISLLNCDNSGKLLLFCSENTYLSVFNTDSKEIKEVCSAQSDLCVNRAWFDAYGSVSYIGFTVHNGFFFSTETIDDEVQLEGFVCYGDPLFGYTPEGYVVSVHRGTRTIRVFDPVSKLKIAALKVRSFPIHGQDMSFHTRVLCLSLDGKYACVQTLGLLRVFEVIDKRNCYRSRWYLGPAKASIRFPLTRTFRAVFFASNKKLAIIKAHKSVVVWNWTQKQKQDLEVYLGTHSEGCSSICGSECGRFVSANVGNNTICVYDVEKRQLISTKITPDKPTCLFSKDGSRFFIESAHIFTAAETKSRVQIFDTGVWPMPSEQILSIFPSANTALWPKSALPDDKKKSGDENERDKAQSSARKATTGRRPHCALLDSFASNILFEVHLLKTIRSFL